jgi:hypothetical protein
MLAMNVRETRKNRNATVMKGNTYFGITCPDLIGNPGTMRPGEINLSSVFGSPREVISGFEIVKWKSIKWNWLFLLLLVD